MDKDAAKRELIIPGNEWRLLARPASRPPQPEYRVPLAQAGEVARDLTEARREVIERDETVYPAGAQRSEMVAKKLADLRMIEKMSRELEAFAPTSALTVGDEAEVFLREQNE